MCQQPKTRVCYYSILHTYILDVLWGQQIKLVHVASATELCENQWKDFFFFEIVPCHFCGASGVQIWNRSWLIYFLISNKVRGIFSIIEIRVVFVENSIFKIDIFWGHKVLKFYSKCSKNAISWNIRVPKYPLFNEEYFWSKLFIHT